jgi:hypothetical protein
MIFLPSSILSFDTWYDTMSAEEGSKTISDQTAAH